MTGPLETFANAGGVHLARAILAEFAENVARLMAEQTIGATGEAAPLAAAVATGRAPPPESLPPASGARCGRAGKNRFAPRSRGAGSGGKILWCASWFQRLRQVFSGKREARWSDNQSFRRSGPGLRRRGGRHAVHVDGRRQHLYWSASMADQPEGPADPMRDATSIVCPSGDG